MVEAVDAWQVVGVNSARPRDGPVSQDGPASHRRRGSNSSGPEPEGVSFLFLDSRESNSDDVKFILN
jgi:hypothetical protein